MTTTNPFYNVILEKPSGDKYLVAQTSSPQEYVDMEWPSAHLENTYHNDDESIEELEYVLSDEGIFIYVIRVRPMTFNTLLTEVDFNKMRRT